MHRVMESTEGVTSKISQLRSPSRVVITKLTLSPTQMKMPGRQVCPMEIQTDLGQP